MSTFLTFSSDVEIYQLTAANGLILLSQDKPEFMKIAVDWLNKYKK